MQVMSKFPDDSIRAARYQEVRTCQKLLSDLPLIYAVTKHGGLAEASAALGYKGPTALSNRIRRLEIKELGGTIFEGHSKLTALGHKLSNLAAKVIPEVQAFISEHRAATRFRIASVTSVWDRYRTEIRKRSHDGEAGWVVLDEDVTFIGHTEESIPLIQDGRVDVGIVTYRPRYPLPDTLTITAKAWQMQEMVMVMSCKKGLAHHNWGGPDFFDSFGAVMLQHGYGIRDRSVDPYLKAAKKVPRIVAELKSVAEIKDLVAGNPEFITILPRQTVEGDQRLSWSKLKGIKKRPVNFIYRKRPGDMVKKFLSCFPEVQR